MFIKKKVNFTFILYSENEHIILMPFHRMVVLIYMNVMFTVQWEMTYPKQR